MGDFSNYADQGVHVGRTVEFEITELTNDDGTHPAVDVEHLGMANVSLTEEVIAEAGSPEEPASTTLERELANRETIIKHCVRHLKRVYFSDGTPATDADIPGFVRSLPARPFARLGVFVMDEENFCKRPKIKTKATDLAEK